MRSSRHTIGIIGPLVVIMIFILSGLAVLVLSANAFEAASSSAADNYSFRTCSSYVIEKARQNDCESSLKVESIEGQDCLVLRHKSESPEDAAYTTYIYQYDGALREMVVAENAYFTMDMGREIADLDGMNIDKLSDNLYKMTLIDADGESYSVCIGERSGR